MARLVVLPYDHVILHSSSVDVFLHCYQSDPRLVADVELPLQADYVLHMTLRDANPTEHLLRAAEEHDKPNPAYDTLCDLSRDPYTIEVLNATTAIHCLYRSDEHPHRHCQLRPKSRASEACRNRRLPQDITVK